MAIKYVLYPNPLTNTPDDRRAVVKDQTKRSMDDIIERMIRRGSTVTRAEALAVIEEYHAAIRAFIADGDRIASPMWQVSVAIKGRFSGDDDQYDPDRHQVSLAVNAGPALFDLAEELTPQRIAGALPKPAPLRFYDVTSDTQNDRLTPGGSAKVRGRRLKIDSDDTRQGVFLIGSDGSETRVQQYLYNKPSQLIIMIPDTLLPGQYHTEVRSKPRHNQSDIRSGHLGHTLTAT